MRRPSLLTLAILLVVAVLVGTVLVLVFAGTARAPQSADAGSGEATEGPAASIGADGPLDPAAVPWLLVQQMGGPAPGSYNVQAGTLGEPAPIIDVEVPWTSDPMAEPARRPAAGQAGDGTIVYVEDDGVRSLVHGLELEADAQPETLGAVEDLVWSIAVTRDGRNAYLGLAERGAPDHHTGVVRLALDGSGDTEVVMAAVAASDVRLVAVSSLVELRLAVDDRQLVRQLCTGARGCEWDVLDIASGRTLALGTTAPISVAAGAALIDRCGQVTCTKEVIDLGTGESVPLEDDVFEAQLMPVDGRPIVAVVTGDPMAASSTIDLIDPATGERRQLYEPDAPAPIMLAGMQVPLVLTVPPTHVLASVGTGDAGAVIGFATIAIPIDGGPPVELPAPPFRQEPPPGVQG